jgi:hypothetical protein
MARASKGSWGLFPDCVQFRSAEEHHVQCALILERAEILSSIEQSQGLTIIAGEFGPPGRLNANGTMGGAGRFVGYMQAYGIPEYPWSWDDATNQWSEHSVLSLTIGSSSLGMYSLARPSDLTEFRMDVLLNPRTGLGALDNKADFF